MVDALGALVRDGVVDIAAPRARPRPIAPRSFSPSNATALHLERRKASLIRGNLRGPAPFSSRHRERSPRSAAERRTRTDQARRDYEDFLAQRATPLFHQVAAALKAEGQAFAVFTPAASVRLAAERSPEEFIELVLDDSSNPPPSSDAPRAVEGEEPSAPNGQSARESRSPSSRTRTSGLLARRDRVAR